jgi:hypothetical protein
MMNRKLLATMGREMMVNPIGLTCPSLTLGLLLSILGGRFIGVPELLGNGFATYSLGAVVALFLTLIFMEFVFAPFWGWNYSSRIKKDYGPKTLSAVQDYYSSQSNSNETFDLESVADSYGELRKE